MIVTGKRTTYDGSWRLIQYETDDQGEIKPALSKSHLDDVIDSYYVQREREFRRLLGELLEGRLSPIGFFVRWQHMTVPDVAARMRLRQSKVKAHLTPSGFRRADVETLERYARIFDVKVGDFFQFTQIDDALSVEVEHSVDGLVQHLKLATRATAAP
jgi:hypothetical protein